MSEDNIGFQCACPEACIIHPGNNFKNPALDSRQAAPGSQEPPAQLMEKLAKLQKEFPNGFVIFLPPQQKGSTWVGCFRFNPFNVSIIEAIYNNIVGNRMSGGSQN